MAKKLINKSICITDDVNAYIESYRGNGFDEKLKNLVLDYQEGEKEIQRVIDYKKKELQDVTFELFDAMERMNILKRAEAKMEQFERSAEGCDKVLKNVAHDLLQLVDRSLYLATTKEDMKSRKE